MKINIFRVDPNNISALHKKTPTAHNRSFREQCFF